MGGLQFAGRGGERRNGVKQKGEEIWDTGKGGEGRVAIRWEGRGNKRRDGTMRKWEGYDFLGGERRGDGLREDQEQGKGRKG